MSKANFLFVCVVVFVVVFLTLDQLNFKSLGEWIQLSIAPIFAVFYFVRNEVKSSRFSVFLIIYSIGSVLQPFDLETYPDLMYYFCNGLYIIAYFFLLLELLKTMSLRGVYKKLIIQLLILIALNVYLINNLTTLVLPSIFNEDYEFGVFVLEIVYNVLLLLILSMAFLNYLENENRKTLILFIGCSFIVVSEFLLLGFYYLLESYFLNYFSAILYVVAFSLLYFQSNLEFGRERIGVSI